MLLFFLDKDCDHFENGDTSKIYKTLKWHSDPENRQPAGSKVPVNLVPIIGKLSLEGGIDSETTNINTASDRSTVISSDTFSPLSTGNIKVRAATADVRMHGNIIVRR